MRCADQIRRWQRVGLCSLLCLAVSGFAIARTDTSSPAKKPTHAAAAHTGAARTAKTKHSSSGRATTKHAPSGTSAQRTSAQRSRTGRTTRGKKGSKRTAVQADNKKKRGQQGIDSDRAREIQEALIREHYMQGEPSGTWDAATQAAMQRYQADHGWQSKTTPDSRALIKLGLGPSHENLLNPESAMTTPAAPASTIDPKASPNQTPAPDKLPEQ